MLQLQPARGARERVLLTSKEVACILQASRRFATADGGPNERVVACALRQAERGRPAVAPGFAVTRDGAGRRRVAATTLRDLLADDLTALAVLAGVTSGELTVIETPVAPRTTSSPLWALLGREGR